jgi:two-component system OmpR family sensor kinase
VSRPAPGTLLRILLPALAGAAVAVVLQLTESTVRLYAAIAPALLAVILGLLGTAALIAGTVVRQRTAAAVAAAEAAAAGRAAAQAAQDRLRFLARLDHELKNPLTAMRAGLANADQALARSAAVSPRGSGPPFPLAQALPDNGDPVDGARTALTSVSGQADRITRLVSDLRRLADLEALQIEMAPVDLSRLLGEVAEASAGLPGAVERSIRSSVPQAPWPLPLVDGDRDLLFVAVQNLVANAVKYSRPGDTLEIRASEDGDSVLVEVADTGIGIPPDEVGQVWEELARGRAARAIPGTGIGLALVRVIVARHGGRVALRSREGQGTVVSVWLPVPGRSRTAPGVADLRQHGDTDGATAL